MQGEGEEAMASRGNFSLHMVCRGERPTTEVAPQNWERGDTRMLLPGCHTIREACSRGVREADGAEKGSPGRSWRIGRFDT